MKSDFARPTQTDFYISQIIPKKMAFKIFQLCGNEDHHIANTLCISRIAISLNIIQAQTTQTLQSLKNGNKIQIQHANTVGSPCKNEQGQSCHAPDLSALKRLLSSQQCDAHKEMFIIAISYTNI
jgi:hypothetical protein